MTASLTWQEIDNALSALKDDLKRMGSRLHLQTLKLKNTLIDIDDLKDQVLQEIRKEEAQQDALDYT